MKKVLRLTESDLVKLIQKVVSEQIDYDKEYYEKYPQHKEEIAENKYPRERPLIIPNDPNVYSYVFSGSDAAGYVYSLYTKLKTENKWTWRRVNPVDNQKAYCSIYYKYGDILGMPEKTQTSYCSNINRNAIPKYTGSHN
jgi:hypothetical protein